MQQDGKNMCSSKVISCAKDDTGNVINVKNYNSILDARMYNVIFLYLYLQQYAANVISEKGTHRLALKYTSIS